MAGRQSWGNRVLMTVLIAMLGVVGVMFVPAYHRYRHLGEELLKARRELDERDQRLTELTLRLFRIKNDPAEVERVAREIYGFCRPDEIIVRYEAPNPKAGSGK